MSNTTMTSEQATLGQLARRVRLSCRYGARREWDKQDEWQKESNGWNCTLHYEGRQYTFDFWMGRALKGEPTAQDVLECLLSDANSDTSDFEAFCSEFGYDTDSRAAERTWRACQRVQANMKRLLRDDFDTFLYASRD